MPKKKTSTDKGSTGSMAAAGPSAFERLPRNPQERAILAERLELLGSEPEQAAPRHEESVVVFRLGAREQYAVRYEDAEEILPPSRIASVPSTPAHIAGVVNRRGELLTVLDLQQFFRTEPSENDEGRRILAVSAAGMTVGVLVDELLGYERVDWEGITPPIPSTGVSNLDYVHGIHRGAVTLIDMEALLGDPALVVEERVG